MNAQDLLAHILTELTQKIEKTNENIEELNKKLDGILKIIGFYEIDKLPIKKYNIAEKKCKYCKGLITWDDWEKGKQPIHIDKEGSILGDGTCPEFR